MLNRLVLTLMLVGSSLCASEIQKSTTETLCKTLEGFFGGKTISLEAPFALYSTLDDWRNDPSGQTRQLPGMRLSYSYVCDSAKGTAEIKSFNVYNYEEAKNGKIELGDAGYLLESEKFIVDTEGKLYLEHTFQSPFAGIAEDRVPRTHKFETILDAKAFSLTTQIVVDDLKTDKKSCSDSTQEPPKKVACRAVQKSTLQRESDTKVVVVREKLAQFYDKNWKFIPNSGWKFGPDVVNTTVWKDVQEGYAARKLKP